MRLHQALLTIVLSGLAISCSKKDFTGKALNSYFENPGRQCTSKTVSNIEAQSLFETKGRKTQIIENNYGDVNPGSFEKASDLFLSAGKELVFVADERCVKKEREGGVNQKRLSSALKISNRAPAGEKSFLVTLQDDTLLSTLEELAESDPCLKGIGENVIYTTMAAPNDPQYNQQEHLTNMKASQGWDVFFDISTGLQQNITVAIIDSGVDQDHPDLASSRWINTGEIAGNGVDDDGNGYVDDVYGYNFASNIANPNPQTWPSPDTGGETHGTHVAGLAAATSNNSVGVAGVNGLKSRIMSLNVFGAVAGASTPSIDNAIRYAADNGAHIINMSLGGPGAASSTDTAIKYAISKGVVVIMAAGNDNADANGFSPARYGQSNLGAMTVGATDSVSNMKCSFSNYSTAYVEIAAPGCKAGTQGVLATLNGGGYGRLQGTSMSSPVTAGVASLAYGLIWARTGNKPAPAKVEEVMKAGARVESSLTGSFMAGKVVDLAVLSDEINKRYPAGATSPLPDGQAPVGCP